jgi:beta-galactosidase
MPPRHKAKVALVLDYPSRWASRSLPQGESYCASHIALEWYAAASRFGADVDVIGQHSDLEGYALVLAPDLLIPTPVFLEKLTQSSAKVLFGPRSGSKTADMHIPANLPPGPLATLLKMKVTRVESLPDYAPQQVVFGNSSYEAKGWRETLVSEEPVLARFDGDYRNASPAMIGNDKARYLATLATGDLMRAIMADTLAWAKVDTLPDLGDIRIARRGDLVFGFNYGSKPAALPAGPQAVFLLGGPVLAPVDVAIWREG